MNGPTADAPPAGLMGVVRRLYDWMLSWAKTPYGPLALGALSFIESSFFPIPPDPLLIALCLGDRSRSWMFAFTCTIASVLGGLFGYWIGATAFDVVGMPILEFYGKAGDVEYFRAQFQAGSALWVFIGAFTPVPYKLLTITAGLAGMNIPLFLLSSAIGRGGRFFLVAGLVWWKGEPVAAFIERYFDKLALAFGVLLVGGFLAARLAFAP